MQRVSEGYRHNTNADVYDERTLKTCEVIGGMQTQHKPYTSETLNLQLKYGGVKQHTNNSNHQSNDAHHAYANHIYRERPKMRDQMDNLDNRKAQADLNDLMNSLMSKTGIGCYNGGNVETVNRNGSVINNTKSSDTLTPMTNGNKHWKNISKRISLQSNHTPKISPDESDSNDTDTQLNSERNPGVHYKTSPRTDSASKNSSRSFNEEFYYDGMPAESASPLLTKKSSTMLLDTIASTPLKGTTSETRFRRVLSKSNWPQESEINFIMLVGLLFTITLSRILHYLQAYCGWFMGQVLHLRYMFLEPNVSIWELCNFDDTSRYALRTKLLLLPFAGTCSLLYGLSSMLHSTLRCLLTQAPNSIIVFIQKLYLNP
uniref:Uncharacterized protein n=1 Tax=Zeugodacus cucurbitae TaxID=28588 RepID=A0A0A1WZ62_ZEUCU